MSREYAKRSKGGGNLPLIIAIVGTVIVVAVIIYFLVGNKGGGSSFLGNKETPSPEATFTPVANSPTPSATPAITPAPTILLVSPSEAVSAAVATQAPTFTPPPSYKTATVWANALKVREGPGLDYASIGSVKRNQTFKVLEETSKFLKIQLSSGAYGWVWADYCVRGDAALPAAPTKAPADSYVKSASLNSAGTEITITFDGNAYSSSAKSLSEIIPITAFTVKEGTTSKLTGFSAGGSCAGGTYVKLQLSGTTGAKLTLTVDGDKVFDTDGKKTGDFSKDFNDGGADTVKPTVSFSGGTSTKTITVTFSENVGSSTDGTGGLDSGDFFLSGEKGVSLSGVSHSGGSKTATITFAFSESMSTNDTAICTLTLKPSSAYDTSGNSCAQTPYNFTYKEP